MRFEDPRLLIMLACTGQKGVTARRASSRKRLDPDLQRALPQRASALLRRAGRPAFRQGRQRCQASCGACSTLLPERAPHFDGVPGGARKDVGATASNVCPASRLCCLALAQLFSASECKLQIDPKLQISSRQFAIRPAAAAVTHIDMGKGDEVRRKTPVLSPTEFDLRTCQQQ